MAELFLDSRLSAMAARNRITAEDVLSLRRVMYADGIASRNEAESLFALNNSCSDRCDEWTEFMVEMVCDYIVNQEKPAGYITENNADWLVAMISRDGIVDSVAELEMLIKVLEKATSSPESLSVFALRQVQNAVVDGTGPLFKSRKLQGNSISKVETDLIRRILFAYGGSGGVAVSQAEADVLFEINDKSSEFQNDASWNELFVKAIANFMMASSGYAVPSRETALRHEAFLDSADTGLGGFLSKMFSGGFGGIKDAYATDSSVESRAKALNAAREAEYATNEVVSQSEAQWIADRIGRDGTLHANERLLLEFLKRESPSIHPDLMKLLDKVA
jgi:hypothetical protein